MPYKICFNCGLRHQSIMTKRQRLCQGCLVTMFTSLVNELIPAVYEFNDAQIQGIMEATKRLGIAARADYYSRSQYLQDLKERLKEG